MVLNVIPTQMPSRNFVSEYSFDRTLLNRALQQLGTVQLSACDTNADVKYSKDHGYTTLSQVVPPPVADTLQFQSHFVS